MDFCFELMKIATPSVNKAMEKLNRFSYLKKSVSGDFAILLKSGMSIKQAFLCNLLSAGLQIVGAVVGVILGALENINSSQWLFAFAGGIFLYIGLVDMVSFNTQHICRYVA